MPLSIINRDITEIDCDAIVNPTNNALLSHGQSVDGEIHRKIGIELDEECILLGGCETGKAKITKGYSLPCRYIIHTVPPVWRGGKYRENEFLTSCYRESLKLCKRHGFKSVAFPIIASGTNGYPKEEAFKIAVREIKAFLEKNEMLIYIAVYDPAAVVLGIKFKEDIASYVSEHEKISAETTLHEDVNAKIEQYLISSVETFSDCLFRFIDAKGMNDPQCYKKANLDRKHFSKIRSGTIKPKKTTVFALALALELNLIEAEELLKSAGYAFSHSDKLDLIVEYFIQNGQYDIYDVNFTLNALGQPILGVV